jgi:tetratricopeptide (TPR) repeat protein
MRHFRLSSPFLVLALSAALGSLTAEAFAGDLSQRPAESQPIPDQPMPPPLGNGAPGAGMGSNAGKPPLVSPPRAASPQASAPQTSAPKVVAKPPSDSRPVETAVTGQNAVDPLFSALKRERDPDKAKGIARQIMSDMSDSGSPTVNLLMQWAATAIKDKRNAAALDFLDQAIDLEPRYTEAWNRRATLNYVMGDRAKSMADIAEVLRLEPRHFGALAGMAGILTEAGKDDLALKAWERYLDVYPADRDAQKAVADLSEKLAGTRT